PRRRRAACRTPASASTSATGWARSGSAGRGATRRPLRSATATGWWVLGTATASFNASRAQASIKVRLGADCTATVSGTGADLGTGQTTVFAILAADRLGLPVDRVRPGIGDSTLPHAANAGGSSSPAPNGPA